MFQALQLAFKLTLQHDSGGFEFVGDSFKLTAGAVAELEKDLKKVPTSNRISFIFICEYFFAREMTKLEQSVRLCNICCDFMVCVYVQCSALVDVE